MLTVEDALRSVMSHALPLPSRPMPLAESLGCTLAEDVASDLDLPPFDKSMVDGYAVRSADVNAGLRRLQVVEQVTAGQVPTRPLGPGESTSIMTGAPLPEGADAVVMHEKTRRDDAWVEILVHDLEPGKNRLARGREVRRGEVVLAAGFPLSPVRIALLASVGKVEVCVIPRPQVSVISTGSELVEPDLLPGPGQIRNSNASMLAALARSDGALVRSFPIVPDDPAALRQALGAGLETDVLVITGGVSVGVHDLVPQTLQLLGIERIFHKVRLKPGKPVWFGKGARNDRSPAPARLVFGLPGNPVSGLVAYLVFVRPTLAALCGCADPIAPLVQAKLGRPYEHTGDRPTFHPARLEKQEGGALPRVEPLDWAGSADLRTVAQADGFALFPAGDHTHRAGEIVRFLPLR